MRELETRKLFYNKWQYRVQFSEMPLMKRIKFNNPISIDDYINSQCLPTDRNIWTFRKMPKSEAKQYKICSKMLTTFFNDKITSNKVEIKQYMFGHNVMLSPIDKDFLVPPHHIKLFAYTNDLTIVDDIITTFHTTKNAICIDSISRPNPLMINALLSDKKTIVYDKLPFGKFKYKSIIGSRNFVTTSFFSRKQEQLLETINSAPDDMRITLHGESILKGIWSGDNPTISIYYNDKQILTWLLFQIGDTKIETFKCVSKEESIT